MICLQNDLRDGKNSDKLIQSTRNKQWRSQAG